ncbi:MAG: UDP-3-O-(3-hydroxymyristoyl)glucosamine N-acyltransferase [Acidobacteria bacterium]|jgi:UDP-3-O-[3-hydroxymyristoyl] glucosamine N-acyltransferase|nr:MAG: UDP-3-O-(3-hydroxymyristoyl)glucosamine N-acyltransferase [Acidobacteriota bacterium]GIU81481.1 MAG: UDP-3-O-acylglucosamine N-acyltransferase [Pyrinomonadaceae bacterium]
MKIREIAELVQGELVGDAEMEIVRVALPELAGEKEIAFIERAENLPENVKASCLIVPENFAKELHCSIIKVKNPKLAFAKVAGVLYRFQAPKKRNQTAFIAEDAEVEADFIGAFVSIGSKTKIGKGTAIFDNVTIGSDVEIGENCVIFPNCVIYDRVRIGNNCVLHAGVVVGADGFGYVRDEKEYVKFPQIGTVVIEDDVEVGANTCIDRGALGETRIGAGTKIDNLVQIAHNVRIGKRVVIAAQTGISGSTVIEDDCVIGGQVGIGDHATLKSGAVIGSQAGILPGKIVRAGVWWGTPVQPLAEYKRLNAHFRNLERFKEEIKALKEKLNELEKLIS